MTTRLQEIEARLKAATPGPWEYQSTLEKTDWIATLKSKSGRLIFSVPNHPTKITLINGEDMVFIAHAPSDIAYLLALAKAGKVAVQTLRKISHLDYLDRANSPIAVGLAAEAIAAYDRVAQEGQANA